LTRVTTRAFAGTIADTADMRCETWWLVPEIAFCVPQRPNPFSASFRGGCLGVLRPGNAFAVRRLRQVANPKKVAPCQKACNALPACTEATFAVVGGVGKRKPRHCACSKRRNGGALFANTFIRALRAILFGTSFFGSTLQSKGENRHQSPSNSLAKST